MKSSVTLWVAVAVIVLPLRPWAQAAPPAGADEVAGNIRVAAMIPAGISTRDACVGFRSLGECSAALHASQNLSIGFADLRERLMSGQSLGAAIHAIKPTVDSLRAVRRARQQAREDLRPPG